MIYRGLRRLPRFFSTTSILRSEPVREKAKRGLLRVVGVSALGFGLWWYYWPHHTFPSSVAAILRNGLWSETSKYGKNYKRGLKFYLEALEECKRVGVDTLSDEYTGIEIKVAEMYENLDDLDSACDVYDEIMQRYQSFLLANDSYDMRRVTNYIKRDLRVMIKYLKHRDDKYVGKNILLHHLGTVQKVIFTRYPEIADFLSEQQRILDTVVRKTPDGQIPFGSLHLFENSKQFESNKEHILSGVSLDEVVAPFQDELFTALDLFTEYCLKSNDIAAALRNQLMTVQFMVLAKVKKSQILFSQANLGSILYLQAEKIEGVLYKLRKENAEKQHADVNDDVYTLENEPANTVINEDNSYYIKLLEYNHNRYVNLSLQCFEEVVNNAERTDNFEEVIDPLTLKAAALSVYGIGVWNIHEGNLKKARRLLKEAVKFSKETSFESLQKEADKELIKVRKMIKTKKVAPPLKEQEIS
ncbi:Protein MRG3-like [Nakaseomyces bracarensis]|uniref:Protein MRG3-like n=1 Tax=Nakaseomyces bracarensis TaxID=273131 RepID=A0ABR4NMI0_9SACH